MFEDGNVLGESSSESPPLVYASLATPLEHDDDDDMFLRLLLLFVPLHESGMTECTLGDNCLRVYVT